MSILFHGRGLFGVGERTYTLARQVFETYPDQVTPADRLRALKFAVARYILHFSNRMTRGWCWTARSHLLEGMEEPYPPDVGYLWGFMGWVAHLRGQPALAREHLRRSVALCREIHFEFAEWGALGLLGAVEFGSGNYADAIQYHQQGLSVSEQNWFVVGTLFNLASLGSAWCMAGDVQQGRDLLRRSLILNREILVVDPIFMALVGFVMLPEQTNDPYTTLETLAVVLHHPQCGSVGRNQAEHTLTLCRTHFSTQEIDAVMDRARRGQLATAHLRSDFSVSTGV